MKAKERFCCLMSLSLIAIIYHHVAASQSQMTQQDEMKCLDLEAAIGQCFPGPGDELIMLTVTESHVSYRFLAEMRRTKSISYGALTPDKGICKGSTPAYRSCLPGSNPGSDRGCKSVYRCRSGPGSGSP